MLRALRRWWEDYVASIPRSEVVDSVPESQWDRADLLPPVSRAKRKAFKDLLVLVYSHLPPHDAEPLVQRGAKALVRGDEIDSALRNALLPQASEGEPLDPGFIACDWKAVEEVQWQADLLCQAHRTSGRWIAPAGELASTLQSLDAWLQIQGRRLLCFHDGDGLVAFALATDQVPSAMAIGESLKLAIAAPGDA